MKEINDTKIFKNNVESLLKYKNVVGISIATRSDVISEEYLNYFDDLNKRTFLTKLSKKFR